MMNGGTIIFYIFEATMITAQTYGLTVTPLET